MVTKPTDNNAPVVSPYEVVPGATDGNDRLQGNDGSNLLDGGLGNDILIGGGGTIAATEGKDVELPAGTVLRVRVDSPLNLSR